MSELHPYGCQCPECALRYFQGDTSEQCAVLTRRLEAAEKVIEKQGHYISELTAVCHGEIGSEWQSDYQLKLESEVDLARRAWEETR